MKKIKIEKNTVQETLIIPLYGRKMCSEKFPKLYTDIFAKELCDRLDYDFSELEKKNNSFLYEFGSLEAAMRQLDMIWEIKAYLKKRPKATIVNLGCGLDETGKACDNGLCRIVNVDFPDVISARKQLITEQEREKNIACDLKDYSWMDEVDGSNGVIFFAAGVFHYFKMDEVKSLALELSKRYSGGRLVFDSVGKLGLKLMMATALKNMGINNVDGLFYVNNPKKELNWSERIKVTSKGYMLGYYDMKSPGIRFSHRLLAKMADKIIKMAINKMEFE
ncbi:MAG TPA: class I SAM-dependent methyltransferase [Spirochaetota bacterium]|jgi:O-methyltransferase involved in polyketide biosynthesis|nr:MAG: Leucine carboxyl methyltransferase [Spirochaetes bacterium ADurb.Bin133]HNZ25834.1 class I SAM-dependent methyltransferase [Spirochaetota bacterium]HOF00624.1 class I SAM-dependent methyltransferase [Spirochaetota bacterium]HOS32602.1 class I SAM-dependent methyltransferase [Spirochaetota bacterium]HOS55935.1 class I SAM-dependent methyltransferase [Spirochaetota bacterium]